MQVCDVVKPLRYRAVGSGRQHDARSEHNDLVRVVDVVLLATRHMNPERRERLPSHQLNYVVGSHQPITWKEFRRRQEPLTV
jgi:hypothetical protein